jgi:hypothetical protein
MIMNDFETTPTYDIDATLKGLKKAELLSLIKQMVQQYPDLVALVEKGEPIPVQAQHAPFNAEACRLEIEKIFYTTDRDSWGSEARAAGPLLDIKQSGDEYVNQGNYIDAATVYELIIRGVLDNYDSFRWHADEGQLDEVVQECVDGLGKCLLGEQFNGVRRQQMIQMLCDAYRFDSELYNDEPVFGRNIAPILIKYTTVDERLSIAKWVRKTFDLHVNWHADHISDDDYDEFLLGLEADTLDDETFLRVCRETESYNYLIERLLKLGRREEALEAAALVDDYYILDIADILIEYSHEGDAVRMIEERAEKSSYKTKLLEWLKEYYLVKGDSTDALEMASRILREHPFSATIEQYQEIRLLAQQVERWDTIRPELLTFLKEGHNTRLQIEIALDESQVGQALELLQSVRQTKDPRNGPYDASSFDVGLAVAKAAEKGYPQEAIEIYQAYVETRIQWRGRENYATASQYLITIRKLYQAMGKKDVWQTYVMDLRQKNSKLPALRDEMAKAKL